MDLLPGDVVWVDLEPTRGREQGGLRPAVVVSSAIFLELVDSLVAVVPLTTRDRMWPNHVPVSGPTNLTHESFAMCEQARTVARERIVRWSGSVDAQTIEQIGIYLRESLIGVDR